MSFTDRLKPHINQDWCNCSEKTGVILSHVLTENPLLCDACNKCLDPDKLEITGPQCDAIASWNSVFGALYSLWLDSGEYELWAKAKLLDRNSQVNSMGLYAIEVLEKQFHVRYEWFWDVDDHFDGLCPVCKRTLANVDGLYDCIKCKVIIRT